VSFALPFRVATADHAGALRCFRLWTGDRSTANAVRIDVSAYRALLSSADVRKHDADHIGPGHASTVHQAR
jgi:hypothetical protein